jgi:serine/threonine protein kinase
MLSCGELIRGTYDIMKILGEGASGFTYLVRDIRFPCAYRALKEIESCDGESGEELFRSFTREAAILEALDHPGLPKVTDAFTLGRSHCIVMEYIEGKTLHELMRERGHPFAPRDVIPWALQLARILEYLHSRDLVFRDLKPANVMVTAGGRIKLIDFGIARYFAPHKSRDTSIMGTPGFAPPEQYGTGQTDARSDIFSFGATIYNLLTNADMVHLNFRYPSLRSSIPGIPEWLDNLVMQCLTMNPGQRVQSAAELVEVLESAGKVVTPPRLVSAAAASSTGSSMGVINWMVIVLIVMVLLAWLVPNFLRARGRGNGLTACKSNMKNMGTAMEMYSSDNQGRYPLSLSQITPNYLRAIPTCADAGKVTYVYVRREKPDNYTIYCSGHYHKGMLAAGFPQYDAINGLCDH